MLEEQARVAELAGDQARLQANVSDMLCDALVEVAPVVTGVIRMALGDHIEQDSLRLNHLQLIIPRHLRIALHDGVKERGDVRVGLEGQLKGEVYIVHSVAIGLTAGELRETK